MISKGQFAAIFTAAAVGGAATYFATSPASAPVPAAPGIQKTDTATPSVAPAARQQTAPAPATQTATTTLSHLVFHKPQGPMFGTPPEPTAAQKAAAQNLKNFFDTSFTPATLKKLETFATQRGVKGAYDNFAAQFAALAKEPNPSDLYLNEKKWRLAQGFAASLRGGDGKKDIAVAVKDYKNLLNSPNFRDMIPMFDALEKTAQDFNAMKQLPAPVTFNTTGPDGTRVTGPVPVAPRTQQQAPRTQQQPTTQPRQFQTASAPAPAQLLPQPPIRAGVTALPGIFHPDVHNDFQAIGLKLAETSNHPLITEENIRGILLKQINASKRYGDVVTSVSTSDFEVRKVMAQSKLVAEAMLADPGLEKAIWDLRGSYKTLNIKRSLANIVTEAQKLERPRMPAPQTIQR